MKHILQCEGKTAVEHRFSWSCLEGYECSSRGDKRFSAFNAQMPDGRTIEEWYQCDIKGYAIGSRNWRLGKGKPSLVTYPGDHLWQLYLNLWRLWVIRDQGVQLIELRARALEHQGILRDSFATHSINQANALATILNEWS